ncbi:MAG: GntR family transcriptional regulator [Propioniciclava sp.]
MTTLGIDPTSATPPFEQLKAQITDGRRTGALAAGQRLPPVRQLAEQVGLAPNTVARAYRELERAGVVETRGRAGTFVLPPDGARHARAREAARDYLAAAAALGLGAEEALRLVTEVARTSDSSTASS